jgi:hypothetical protein
VRFALRILNCFLDIVSEILAVAENIEIFYSDSQG